MDFSKWRKMMIFDSLCVSFQQIDGSVLDQIDVSRDILRWLMFIDFSKSISE